jgi:fluoride exporter
MQAGNSIFDSENKNGNFSAEWQADLSPAPMNFYNLILVGAGGMLGSILRYVTSRSIDEKLNSVFPYGTLSVNIAGSFILGMLYAWLSVKAPENASLKLLIGTGFCGGFTTFSAFAFENVGLWNQKLVGPSLLYVFLTLIIGFSAVVAGLATGKAIFN